MSQKVAGLYSASDTAATLGGGFRWYVNPSVALGAQFDVFVWQNDDIGSIYDLSAGTQQLVLQINF